jgi:hypothetical protein
MIPHIAFGVVFFGMIYIIEAGEFRPEPGKKT